MTHIHFTDLCEVLGQRPLQQSGNVAVDTILTDSRRLLLGEGSLFVAISSNHKNANDFVWPLYQRGVKAFILDREPGESLLCQLPEASIILVPDALAALQQLAAWKRHLFPYPVIGITGSNGKTIVKEWLYQLLNDRYHIVRSPKSYNSQIGVPLSVWAMQANHTLGIFEAGISQRGEMQRLQPVIDPSIGVLTFMGEAHAEGFRSMEEKIREKLQLFRTARQLVYASDDPRVEQVVQHFRHTVNPNLQLFSWGHQPTASLQVLHQEQKEETSIIHLRYREETMSLVIPFTDAASVFNALTCCAVLLLLNQSLVSIARQMHELRPVEMRLELKQGTNQCSVINDSYSADLNSLMIALDFLKQQQQHNRHTVIVSDFVQTGYEPAVLYRKLADSLQQQQLHRLIGIGEAWMQYGQAIDGIPETHFFPDTASFIKAFHKLGFREEVILLKGARVFQFEQISKLLELKQHETVLEINLSALRNNLKLYRQFLRPGVKMMAMVKAFSYGSGSFEVANLLQHAGVDYLAVAYADEGVELRKAGIRLPIMVMNTAEAAFDSLLQYKLEPELYSFQILQSFLAHCRKHQVHRYPVHIKLDTGMHRLGFVLADMPELLTALREQDTLQLQSVFSHLAGSDDPQLDYFTEEQAHLFEQMCTEIESVVQYPFIRHIANTSAIHRHPELQLDMVRLGIGLYGVDRRLNLENVTTLKTTISQIKQVKTGESVGYSRKGIVQRDTTVATVRIGYADGYTRLFGNGKGKMMLNGVLVPVIGNVCMDMTMLDITGVDADEGDEVLVFGEALPVSTLAEWAGTIPYEILTNVSQRVKRIYFDL